MIRTVPLPPGLELLDGARTFRPGVVADPGMCGATALFGGRVGDWTWGTVAAATDFDVFTARTPHDAPAYLSFHYLRLRSRGWKSYTRVEFGERLDITSGCFGFGSESVHTVHRIAPAGTGPLSMPGDDREAGTGFLEAETFNRWVARSRPRDNDSLIPRGPAGFGHERLPILPEDCSPRPHFRRARRDGTFRTAGEPCGRAVRLDRTVSLGRDLNGVGLLYFASYLAYCDEALAELWLGSGRSSGAFAGRDVADFRICYLGNAGPATRLRISARWADDPGAPTREYVDTSIEDDTGRVLAVATYDLRRTAPADEERGGHGPE